MARPKGAKNRPKLTVVGNSPNVGHNQPSDDQVQALTRQHAQKRAKLLEAEKRAKADRMNFDKVIKSDLGAHGLADIKLLEKLETPEGEEEVRAEMERRARVFRWAGIPIGTQGSLFDEDRRPIEDRAFDEGKRAGMEGKHCEPPHPAGTSAASRWVEGWHAGQAILATGFKKPADTPEVLRPEGNEPKGADDFDSAANGGFGGGQPETVDDGAESETTDDIEDDDEVIDDVTDEDDEGGEWPDERQEEAL